jgi:uncharacterized low-complexity protein
LNQKERMKLGVGVSEKDGCGKCGMESVEWKVWNGKCGMESVEWKVWNGKCGMEWNWL